MIPSGILTVSYIAASILFILSLGGLSNQESSRRGNLFGIIGMLIAIAATTGYVVGAFDMPGADAPTLDAPGVGLLAAAILPGALIGAYLAARVAMTSMPELVAVLHSFVGLAAVLVGLSSYMAPLESLVGSEKLIHEIEIFLAVFIGSITFTGSIIAFGKLRGSISGKPLMLPARHALNLAMVVACVVFGVLFVTDEANGLTWLLAMTAIAGLVGLHLVMGIGGADMPVVVSMLNSYSGWAAAAAGFMLENDLLLVTGALVGSSGAILSYIMCSPIARRYRTRCLLRPPAHAPV